MTISLLQNLKLTITPYAFSKIHYIAGLGDTEISGFGVSSIANPLRIEDFCLIKQTAGWASSDLDDDDIARYFLEQVDLGRQPIEFSRIFIHTHPAGGTSPSGVDNETFAKSFGECDWRVMLILSRDLAQHTCSFVAAIRGMGVTVEQPIPFSVDYGLPFKGTDFDAWKTEYETYITKPKVCDTENWFDSYSEGAIECPWFKSKNKSSRSVSCFNCQSFETCDMIPDPLEATQILRKEPPPKRVCPICKAPLKKGACSMCKIKFTTYYTKGKK